MPEEKVHQAKYIVSFFQEKKKLHNPLAEATKNALAIDLSIMKQCKSWYSHQTPRMTMNKRMNPTWSVPLDWEYGQMVFQ